MAADDDDKTEEPTPRKLEQAREKGDIIYTPEVGAALSLLAVTGIVAFLSGPLAIAMSRDFIGFLSMPDQFSTDPRALQSIGVSVMLKVALILGMSMLALMVAGIASRYLQDQPTFTAKRLEPKLDKLDPIKGFGRVFGQQAFATFLKSLAKFVVVAAIMAWVMWPHDSSIENMALLDPAALLPFIKDRAVSMLIAFACAAGLIGIVDYVFTRQSYMKRQRMSRREIKDEHRQQEGDPMVKARLRAIRQQKSRQRMMSQVPNASVIITNPTHYAIALRYEQGQDSAPMCLAKGVDDVALKIREVAKEHDVPIIEDPPLARALFATADIDEPIPREHYEAVAKIIGVIMRLAKRRRRSIL
jgi:flagellar biosynthetic protein FlhB